MEMGLMSTIDSHLDPYHLMDVKNFLGELWWVHQCMAKKALGLLHVGIRLELGIGHN